MCGRQWFVAVSSKYFFMMFYISHKSGINFFFKRLINNCPKNTHLRKLLYIYIYIFLFSIITKTSSYSTKSQYISVLESSYNMLGLKLLCVANPFPKPCPIIFWVVSSYCQEVCLKILFKDTREFRGVHQTAKTAPKPPAK